MLSADYRRSFFCQGVFVNTELHYYRNHVVIFFQSHVFLLIPPEKGKLKNTLLVEDGLLWRKLAYLWVDEIINLFKVLSFSPYTKSASLAQKRSLKKIEENGIYYEYALPNLGALVEKVLITNNTVLSCNYKGSQVTHASGHWLNVNHQGDIEYGLRRFGQCIKYRGNPLKFLTEDSGMTESNTGMDFSILGAMMNSHYSFNQMIDFQRVPKSDADRYLNRHKHVLNLAANLL